LYSNIGFDNLSDNTDIMLIIIVTCMVRWMCKVKVKDRVPTKGLIEGLEIDDIILILQQNRLRWYGHVLRK